MTDQELHDIITAAAEEVRRRASEANIGSNFGMTISVSGRLNSSEPLKIVYKVSEGLWGSNSTEGNALTPVTTEFLRRHGWNKRHSVETLAAPEEIVAPPPAPVPPS